MLTIEEAIDINRYGQELIDLKPLLNRFSKLDPALKRNYLNDILALILQSKPKETDIEPAIEQSKLKPTYTPCVLLRKGVAYHNLKRLADLPDNEQEKTLALLMSLFKIAYQRRFNEEKNNPGKWWYWDLSDRMNVECILKGMLER
jgi:hypothetical protein